MESEVAGEEYDDELPDDAVYTDEREDAARQKYAEKGRRQIARGRLARLADSIAGGPTRPGDQQVIRSPFVLALIGGVLGFGLLAAIFYYIIGRESETRRLNEALLALEQRKYGEAEQLFLKYLEDYPEGGSSETARLSLHKSRVEKQLLTTTPDVSRGLSELQALISVGKDLDGFDNEREAIQRYADRLTYAGARVAEISQQQAPLDISREGLEILRRFSPDGRVPPDREEELIRRQRIAEAAVARRMVFDTALAQTRKLLGEGNTIGAIGTRQAMLDRYEVLRDDPDVAALLQEILTREQQTVVRTEPGTDALTDDLPAELPSLSLNLRTQATNDLVSRQRLVFGVGVDCLYGLDADTGEPRWKRVIGGEPAFAPIAVKGTLPGLLVHSRRTNELLMVRQQDGRLIWRQSIGSSPSGDPLILGQEIYITTARGELWQVSTVNGRITARLTFSQPVVGPPAVSRDGRQLVIPGDAMFVYTMTLNPLTCAAVSYLEHRAGSVESPLLTAGDLFVMTDNHRADSGRVRILELNSSGQLAVRGTELVDGHIRDPLLLRGAELFVPSAPQRVTAFRIAADAGSPLPLAKIGANQLEDGQQTRMFLLAGPGGQLWLGGRSLRKFQLRTNAVLLESGHVAEGIHLQPIQFADQSVFLTYRDASLASVYFIRADPEQMQGTWRTVLGTRVVAAGPAAGDASILVVSDFGRVFRVPLAEISRGGFSLESISEFRLPDKLASSVDGLTLTDGRLGAWCGAPEPLLWTISTTGQLERRWVLPDVPQTAPAAIAAGVVFALPGRLHLTAVSSGVTVEDYRAAQAVSQQSGWKHLTAISDSQVLAVTTENRMVRVEYRPMPRPQLAEISVTPLDHSIEVAPAAANGHVVLATAEGRLILMRADSLEVLASAELGGVPRRSPFLAGDRVFVEVSTGELKTFVLTDSLRPAGSFPLAGRSLAGVPVRLQDGSHLVALNDGAIERLTADGMLAAGGVTIGQTLSRGPLLIAGQLIAVAADGSLYALPAEITR